MTWGEFGTILVSVLGAIGIRELIIYFVNRKANARKAEAEADKATAEARLADAVADGKTLENAFRLIDVLTAQVSLIEKRVSDQARKIENLERVNRSLRAYVQVLLDGIKKLNEQIRCHDDEPVWTPPKMASEE